MSETTVQPVAARFVGQSIARKEDRRLLTGHGQYVDDVAVPGLLHGAFLRSEVARGTIAGIDTSAAEALPGVIAVFTWSDFDGRFGEAWHAMLGEEMVVPPPLAIGDVRHVGDPVAFVVAESRYVAEDACDLIGVDYEPSPQPSTTRRQRRKASRWSTPRGAWSRTRWWACRSWRCPPTSTGVRGRRARQRVHDRAEPLPCGPDGDAGHRRRRGTPGRDELDVDLLDAERPRDPELLRPLSGDRRGQHPGDGTRRRRRVSARRCSSSARSARSCSPPGCSGRPVKWIEDRRENLIAAPHSRNELGHVRIAIDDDRHDPGHDRRSRRRRRRLRRVPGGHGPDAPPGAVPGPAAWASPWRWCGPTPWARARTGARGCSRPPRGRWPSTRRRGRDGDGSRRAATTEPAHGRRPAIHVAFGQGLRGDHARSRRSSRPWRCSTTTRSAREQARARAEGRYLGVGISVYVEPTSMGSPTLYTEAATVRVEASGKVVAYLGTTSHGQSIETTMAQIVADTLGVAMTTSPSCRPTRSRHRTGPGPEGAGQRSSPEARPGEASEAVRGKVLAIAAHAHGGQPRRPRDQRRVGRPSAGPRRGP